MKILSKNLKLDLEKGKPVKLNLGCGEHSRKGFYSVDHLELKGVDLVADLNKPLNLLPDDCCESVFSRHTLEHIDNIIGLMEEIHRITKKDGTVEIIVPHFSNVYAYSDPTHVRFFGLYSMSYFVSEDLQPNTRKVPAFYTNARFRVKSLKIEFYKHTLFDKLFSPTFSKLINYNIWTQNFYERRLAHLFHAWQIRYKLEPVKQS